MARCINNHQYKKDCAWSNTEYHPEDSKHEQYRICCFCQEKLNKGAYHHYQKNSKYGWTIHHKDKNQYNHTCNNLVATHLACNIEFTPSLKELAMQKSEQIKAADIKIYQEIKKLFNDKAEIKGLLASKTWLETEINKRATELKRTKNLTAKFENHILHLRKMINFYQSYLKELSIPTILKVSEPENQWEKLLKSKPWLKEKLSQLTRELNDYNQFFMRLERYKSQAESLILLCQNALKSY